MISKLFLLIIWSQDWRCVPALEVPDLINFGLQDLFKFSAFSWLTADFNDLVAFNGHLSIAVLDLPSNIF